MSEESVNGYEMIVTEAKGGDFEFEQKEMLENEWYPTILVKIDKVELPNSKFGPQFTWIFEVQGEEFEVEFGGKRGQYQIRGNTSLICSKNPESGKMSKFYEWYSKIMGAEPAAGHKISTKDLIGKSCYVMVKANKGVKDPSKIYHNVIMVKGATKKTTAQIPSKILLQVKSIVKGKPAPVAVDVDSDLEEMQAFETTPAAAPVVKKPASKKPDVFADVF